MLGSATNVTAYATDDTVSARGLLRLGPKAVPSMNWARMVCVPGSANVRLVEAVPSGPTDDFVDDAAVDQPQDLPAGWVGRHRGSERGWRSRGDWVRGDSERGRGRRERGSRAPPRTHRRRNWTPCGRVTPRWSSPFTGAVAQTASRPASIATLPALRAIVSVAPPLSARAASARSATDTTLEEDLLSPHEASVARLPPPSVTEPEQAFGTDWAMMRVGDHCIGCLDRAAEPGAAGESAVGCGDRAPGA